MRNESLEDKVIRLDKELSQLKMIVRNLGRKQQVQEGNIRRTKRSAEATSHELTSLTTSLASRSRRS